MKEWILASNSPRRRDLFGLFKMPFRVVPADINEDRIPGEHPVDYVRRLACEKAETVSDQQDGLIIAADTIVADGEELLGKPADSGEAEKILKQLRGRVHQVYTGITILDVEGGQAYSDVCCTNVPMREYTDEEIDAYIATGDPMDKAGAYAIQHPGFHPVERLNGCYASVMGLPLCHLMVGLRHLRYAVSQDVPHECQDLLTYPCPIYQQVLDEKSKS